MKFYKGYIVGVLVCLALCAILIWSFYPKSVRNACNPIINLLGDCLEKNKVLLSNNQTHPKFGSTDFKYKYLFNKITNISFECPKEIYSILVLKNDTYKYYCLNKKFNTFLGIKDLGTQIRYNYLYSIEDGIYELSYKTDTTSFLTLASKNDFDKIYDKNGNIIVFVNPRYDINLQKEMFKNEILKYLKKYNFTYKEGMTDKENITDISKYCLKMDYPFLNSEKIGKETIREIVYDILINRNYLNKINKRMNVFGLNISYQNKLYHIEICFGFDKFKDSFNKRTVNAKNIKELSKKLRGNNTLETAYNILKWVDKNIEYDNEKAKEVINGKNPSLRTPEQVLKDKKAICTEYTMFIDSLLLNNNITPYYVLIKYKNKKIDHAVAAIKYNNTYYILDQHLPLVDMNHYIYSSHICNNDTFDKIIIYKINKEFKKEFVDKITSFDYRLKENKEFLNKIEKELINKISYKFGLKYVKNLFKNKSVKIRKGIIKEVKFYCLYPKFGDTKILDLDAKYLFDEIKTSIDKELSVAKYFDITLTSENNRNIVVKLSFAY